MGISWDPGFCNLDSRLPCLILFSVEWFHSGTIRKLASVNWANREDSKKMTVIVYFIKAIILFFPFELYTQLKFNLITLCVRKEY